MLFVGRWYVVDISGMCVVVVGDRAWGKARVM